MNWRIYVQGSNGETSWTVKKAERRRIDAFEAWCWRRLLRVPWTARRSNQYILKKISPENSLVRVMLKLKILATWYEELTHFKRPWCWKIEDWRQEEKGMTEDELVGWHHRANGHEFESRQELVMDREAWGAAVHEIAWLSNWAELNWTTEQSREEPARNPSPGMSQQPHRRV